MSKNRKALAWPGQRRIRRRYHVGGRVIASAVEKACGIHLQEAGLGPRGVQRYRVLAVRDGADADAASAPAVGALTDPPARPSTPASAPADVSSAPGCDIQRAQRRARNQHSEPTDEPKEGNQDSPPPSCAALQRLNGTATADGHRETEGIQGNEHGTTTDPNEALRLALGRKPTGKELITFRQAVGEAQAAGATDALIAHFVRLAAPGEGVWAGPNAAREEAKRLVDSWAKAGLEPRRQSVLEIIKDVWSAWDYVRQKNLPSWDMGLARNRKVLAWAKREASALRAADGAPPEKEWKGRDL